MKIEIDTKHDSPEEIRKVIKMLQHLVGEDSYTSSNIFEDPNSFGASSSEEPASPAAPTNAFINMFSDSSKKQKKEPMNDSQEEPEENKEEIPKVIPY